MPIQWITNSRRAHQRLGFLKVVLSQAGSAQSSSDLADRVRRVITAGFGTDEQPDMVAWCNVSRNGLLLPQVERALIQAQGYYLFHLPSRTGWLSPKGINEYVEVLPRRIGLADTLFRVTELGHVFQLLIPAEDAQAWEDQSLENNPLELTREQRYYLIHAVLEADGDFLIPWIGALARCFEGRTFSYLQAGECVPDVLRDVGAAFSATAYRDEDRRQLQALDATRSRVEAEIEVRKEKEGSGARRDQLVVPRLEWLVDFGLLTKPQADGTSYTYTQAGQAIARQLADEYQAALRSTYVDQALQFVLDAHFARILSPVLGVAKVSQPAQVLQFLRPAYNLIDSISGYCLLRPLNVLAAITSARSGDPQALEYVDTVRLVEAAYKEHPDAVHYTVDRLTTDYQVKLFGSP